MSNGQEEIQQIVKAFDRDKYRACMRALSQSLSAIRKSFETYKDQVLERTKVFEAAILETINKDRKHGVHPFELGEIKDYIVSSGRNAPDPLVTHKILTEREEVEPYLGELEEPLDGLREVIKGYIPQAKLMRNFNDALIDLDNLREIFWGVISLEEAEDLESKEIKLVGELSRVTGDLKRHITTLLEGEGVDTALRSAVREAIGHDVTAEEICQQIDTLGNFISPLSTLFSSHPDYREGGERGSAER